MSNTLKSYFRNKKRDVSDKSNDGDERKKAKKSNVAVFSEGINSPRCASILYDCLENLDKKANEIHLLSTTMNDVQIKGTQQLKEANDTIKFVKKNLKNLKMIGERKNEK